MTTDARKAHLELLALTVALLFFFDLGAAFVEATYAFGLLATEVPPAVALVAVVFITPLALLPFRRPLPHPALVAIAGAGFACRIAEPLLQQLPRLLVAGAGLSALWMLVPVWLCRTRRALFGQALALACAAAALWRAGGIDASHPAATVALALAGAGALWFVRDEPPAAGDAGFGRTLVIVLGMVCALALGLFAFMAPGVTARWFYLSHATAHLLVALSWVAAIAALSYAPLSRWLVTVAAAAFAVALVAALLLVQPSFPEAPASYPWTWPPPWGVRVVPPLALALSGAVPLALAALVGELGAPTPRKLAGACALGGVLLLALVAAQILTTIYDYVPVVGPLFRDRFWLVTALPAAGLAAALACMRAPVRSERARGALPALATIAVAVLLASHLTEPAPVASPRLRVAGYNIQQGYDAAGDKDREAQLAVLARLDADVIGLSECDTARLAGANADTVRWLARRLGMYAYYGAPPPAGTFGVTLLSRHPITAVSTRYLYSTGEQTAVVVATVAVDEHSYTVAVTHLGNDGPLVQLENVLASLPGSRTIVVGDFNFVAGAPQHRLALARLDDAWDKAARREGERRADDLDHAFVSGDLRVRAAGYARAPASDHPAIFVEVELY